MKRLLCLLALSVWALATPDVNVTGNWSGSFTVIGPGGENKDSTALLRLKQTGTEITGTVGPSEDEQHTIQKGKIEGNQITLEVAAGEHTIRFDLVLAEDTIKGDANMSGEGEERKAKLDVKRVK